MLEKMLQVGLLFDCYGILLTDRQQACIRMHYLEDLSLAEIAEEFHVSRQAVHDILQRAEQTLTEYEEKLGLVERHRNNQATLQYILSLLETLPETISQEPQLIAAANSVRSMLTDERVAD